MKFLKYMKNKKYELLAPAGSFSTLVAAVNAGADAVYFGLKGFNMRAGLKTSEKNFGISDLKKIKKICNEKNVRRYLTLNTIVYDNEIKTIEKIIKKSKEYIDAIICWDLSIIQLCQKYNVPFHISTQASVSNAETARFYKKLGAKNIVLARELNLKQIKKIKKQLPNLNLEVFAHGAMCVSVSGRCFTSQFLFNKSANRGMCLHPCRRSYIVKDKQEGYELEVKNNKIFSAKDLCTLPLIEKMKKAGITTFKIEGRSRDPRYVDTVVKIYRKALDKRMSKKEIQDSLKELKKVYNKGFSSGFYLGVPTSDGFSKVENSSATEKKHFVGKVTHFYPKLNVALVRVSSEINLGDRIAIIGNTTGIKNTKVKQMEIEKKAIKKAKKGQDVGLKVPTRVRKNDKIYKIVSS